MQNTIPEDNHALLLPISLKIKAIVVIFLILMGSQSFAEIASESQRQLFDEALAKLDVEIEEIAQSPIEGFFEVLTNNQEKLFISADGEWVFFDTLIDLRGDSYSVATVFDDAWRLEKIQYVRNIHPPITYTTQAVQPKYSVVVFTDNSCGYCRMFHKEIDAFNERGIEVQYFLYPRGGTTVEAASQMASAYCSADPQMALSRLKNQQTIATAQCDDPVEEHYKLGRSIGVNATPGIVLPSGKLIFGFHEPDQLLSVLEEDLAAG